MRACPICGSESRECFRGTILQRHAVTYYQCTLCGFLQTEAPYWLDEAYAHALNREDTGLVQRNIRFSRLTSIVIAACFNTNGIFVDHAGGCGLFTRLMRDIGFDFYWRDRYADNILSAGLEFDAQRHHPVELVTLFEAMEHFVDPVGELEALLAISNSVLFSTQLLPVPTPDLNHWWYYGTEHGQHVSFFTAESCRRIADRFGLRFYSFGELHLFTSKRISVTHVKLLLKTCDVGSFHYARRRMQSKTETDHAMLRRRGTD